MICFQTLAESDDLKDRIESEESDVKLKAVLRLAARSESMEMFLKEFNEID